MNIDQHLIHVAERYRSQGYKVVIQPKPEDLPDFAKDFKVEIVARRADGAVLVSAKKNRLEFEADHEIPRYVELTEQQPGWRFDVIVMGSESRPIPDKKDAKEPSEQDIHRALEDVERMLQAGFVPQALIAAWAVLETAMRRRLRAEGEEAGWGSSPRTMLNELYSAGVLPSVDFRELEGLFNTRSALVHGFTTPSIENNAVEFLLVTTRMLLNEARAAKQTA